MLSIRASRRGRSFLKSIASGKQATKLAKLGRHMGSLMPPGPPPTRGELYKSEFTEKRKRSPRSSDALKRRRSVGDQSGGHAEIAATNARIRAAQRAISQSRPKVKRPLIVRSAARLPERFQFKCSYRETRVGMCCGEQKVALTTASSEIPHNCGFQATPF